MLRLAAALIVGVVIGLSVGPMAEALMASTFPAQPYARDCLDGDECTMVIRPKGAPWLTVMCELTTPPRCVDGEKP